MRKSDSFGVARDIIETTCRVHNIRAAIEPAWLKIKNDLLADGDDAPDVPQRAWGDTPAHVVDLFENAIEWGRAAAYDDPYDEMLGHA